MRRQPASGARAHTHLEAAGDVELLHSPLKPFGVLLGDDHGYGQRARRVEHALRGVHHRGEAVDHAPERLLDVTAEEDRPGGLEPSEAHGGNATPCHRLGSGL